MNKKLHITQKGNTYFVLIQMSDSLHSSAVRSFVYKEKRKKDFISRWFQEVILQPRGCPNRLLLLHVLVKRTFIPTKSCFSIILRNNKICLTVWNFSKTNRNFSKNPWTTFRKCLRTRCFVNKNQQHNQGNSFDQQFNR